MACLLTDAIDLPNLDRLANPHSIEAQRPCRRRVRFPARLFLTLQFATHYSSPTETNSSAMAKITIAALLLLAGVISHTSSASVFRGLKTLLPEEPAVQQDANGHRALFGGPAPPQKRDFNNGHPSAGVSSGQGDHGHGHDGKHDDHHDDHHNRALFSNPGDENSASDIPQTPDFANSHTGASAPNDPLDGGIRLDEAETVLITSGNTHVEASRQLKQAVTVRCWRDMGTLFCMM